jgi:hypothetical protein
MEITMSFRNKDRKAKKAKKVEAETQTGTEEEDVKVAYAKDSQGGRDQQSQPPQAEQSQATDQPQQAESQTSEQSGDTDSEQSDGDGDEDDEPAPPVPDGTTAEILKWVGGDKKRAQAALDKEQAEKKPRGGLTGELNRILADDEDTKES